MELLGIKSWPIWTREAILFHGRYRRETDLLIARNCSQVTPDHREPVEFAAGDT